MSKIINETEHRAETIRAIDFEISAWNCFEEELQARYDRLQEKYAKSWWLLRLYKHLACRLLANDIGFSYCARKRLHAIKDRLKSEIRGA